MDWKVQSQGTLQLEKMEMDYMLGDIIEIMFSFLGMIMALVSQGVLSFKHKKLYDVCSLFSKNSF